MPEEENFELESEIHNQNEKTYNMQSQVAFLKHEQLRAERRGETKLLKDHQKVNLYRYDMARSHTKCGHTVNLHISSDDSRLEESVYSVSLEDLESPLKIATFFFDTAEEAIQFFDVVRKCHQFNFIHR